MAREVTQAVEQELKNKFRIEHVTVAVDWNEGSSSVCSLSEPSGDNYEHDHDHSLQHQH
ncbi:hypothetical protein [Oceanospirillum maris]|uniref:hypothetical protein n=1 Tax=Oceanospirillum maris TaxID=64977 RepID=UPI0003FD8CD3|nr:hypothetical protein [Oceanospirillum maris]